MAQEDDVARLVAVMEANLNGFTKGMEQAQRIADQKFGAIEKRMQQSEATFSKGFSKVGASLLGGAAFLGIERFVSSVVDTASKFKTTADAIGISTDALQEWSALAAHAGINQDEFNGALERFSQNVGKAQVQGGNLKRILDGLGVGTNGSIEQIFYRFADAIAQTGNQAQKTALITQFFGRNSAGLTAFIQQGSAAIKAQGDELKRTGAIMDASAIGKIDELDKKWTDLKRVFAATGANVLGGFADEFSQFADELKDPAVQQGLREFGAVMADVAIAVAKMAPFMPEIVGGLAGLALGGPTGGLIGIGVGALGAALHGTFGSAAPAAGTPTAVPKPPVGTRDRAGLLTAPLGDKAAAKAAADAVKAALDVVKAINAANVELTKGTLDYYKTQREQIDGNTAAELMAIDEERKAKIAALDQEKLGQADYTKAVNAYNDEAASKESAAIIQQRSERASSIRDELEQRYQLAAGIDQARRDEIRSQHDAILAQVQGTEDYYKVARDLSDEDAKLEKERITDELNHQLDTMARQKQAIDAAGGDWADYETERKAATEKATFAIQAVDNKAAADRINLTEQETHAIAEQTQVMDQVRDGLEGLGEAALNGSKSFVQAVGDMLKQLALLVLKLYVLKPLVESALGPEGTIGGGLIGSLFGAPPATASVESALGHGLDYFGFAKGGVMTSRGKLPLRRYAVGGVARTPQLAMFGEGSGAEAYVPLPDGRSIPVSLRMPQLQPAAQSINVQVQNSYSFAGAVDENSIRRMIAQGDAQTAAGVVTHIQKNMPGYMVKAQRDSL